MSKLEFKAEKFSIPFKEFTSGYIDGKTKEVMFTAGQAAELAQAIYEEHLEGLPKVYSFGKRVSWIDGKVVGSENYTHTARLDAMEKLEKLK